MPTAPEHITSSPDVARGDPRRFQMVKECDGFRNHWPPSGGTFSYTPATEIIGWTDTNGFHQGDLATFNATADFATVTDLQMGMDFQPLRTTPLTAASGFENFPLLNTLAIDSNALPSLDMSVAPWLVTLGFYNNSVAPVLTLTGCSALQNLVAYSSNLSSIVGFSDCTALTYLELEGNLFTSLNLNFLPAHIDTLDLSNNALLTSLVAANVIDTTGDFKAAGCVVMTTFTITSFAGCGGTFDIHGCTSLTALSIPTAAFACTGDFLASGCTSMVAITFGSGPSFGGGLDFHGNTALTTFTMPGTYSIVGIFDIHGCTSVVSAALGGLVSCSGLDSTGNTAMTSITLTNWVNSPSQSYFTNCSALTSFSIPSAGFASDQLDFIGCSSLTSISIGTGANISGLQCTALTALVSVSIPNITLGAGVDFKGCLSFTTLSLGNATFADSVYEFSNCALAVGDSTHGVDGVLARGVASATTAATYRLGGGTNSTPSVTGQSNKSLLILAGNTVITN